MNRRGRPDQGEGSRPDLREAFLVWARVAAQSFGGPAGQIAVMHRIVVEEKRWVDEARFLHALSYCMLLPGPEAQQLATYLGWLRHGTVGGLLAGTLFVLPGMIAILALSVLYVHFGETWLLAGLFYGLKPAVLAVVVEAVLRLGRKALHQPWHKVVAVLALVGIGLLDLPFPAIIAAAALIGLRASTLAPDSAGPDGAGPDGAGPDGVGPDSAGPDGAGPDGASKEATPEHLAETRDPSPPLPGWRRSARVLAMGLVAWGAPPFLLLCLLGRDHVVVDQALFFSQAAVLTFGGAYAVLSYISQKAVETFGWLSPGEMLDGLGLAETTPGPLIMVVQFVAFLGAYRHPGELEPLSAAILGSLVTVWVTFVPSFLWIFLGAPYVESLRGNRRWRSALAGITAAVVGLILHLAVFFSMHTLFGEIRLLSLGILRLQVPTWQSLDPAVLALTLLAFVALFGWKLGLGKTLALSSGAGLWLYLLR